MSNRDTTNRVRSAILKLFPDSFDEVLDLMAGKTGSERVHADLLAISFGDVQRLRELCDYPQFDTRDVMVLEDRPEECMDSPHRPTAAAELAKRFVELGFDVPSQTAYWAQFAEDS